jgi:Collagen triple helix repeat (20 copies)
MHMAVSNIGWRDSARHSGPWEFVHNTIWICVITSATGQTAYFTLAKRSHRHTAIEVTRDSSFQEYIAARGSCRVDQIENPEYFKFRRCIMKSLIFTGFAVMALGLSACTGPAGPQGPTGEQGAPGNQGIQGNTGQQGATGNQGNAGDTGQQGATGNRGSTGEQGNKGTNGN